MNRALSRRHLVSLAGAMPLAFAAPMARAAAAPAPRLFFTPGALTRARSLKQGALATAWRNTRATADKIHQTGQVRFAAHATSPDKDRGWQRDVGNGIATLAACYLLEQQTTDRDFAIAQALEAGSFAVWGSDAMDGADLAAGHLLFGTAMALNWLGEGMDGDTRGKLVATLRRRGAQMVAAARGTNGKPAYWSEAWQQNHLWVTMAGLLAAGLALQADDAKASAEMVGVSTDRMTRAFAALLPDGSSQEGPGYWDYGAEYLLKFHDMATEHLELPLDGEWLRGAASYRAATTLPEASWSASLSMLNPADAPLSPWCGPEYMLRRLAALNHDPLAQDLAFKLEAAGAVFPASPWLNLVWYDPAVPRTGGAAHPLLQHFSDLDLVVARSDRSGHEAVVLMRAGPPLGKRAQAAHYNHDTGVGHVHPDVNHVTLFAAGEYLLRDDGYAGTKDTVHHNTLLVGGAGQAGSGHQWTYYSKYPLPDPQPRIALTQSQATYDYWVGEGASAYPASTGLRRFDRHVLFAKPDILVVIDDLDAAAQAEFKLLWHPGAAALPSGEQQYRSTSGNAALHIAFVLPGGATHGASQRALMTHENKSAALDELAVTMVAQSGQCGALFAWGPTSSPPPLAQLTHQAGVWTVTAPGRTLRLNVGERRVSAA